MKIKRIALVAFCSSALVIGMAGTSTAEDYNQGDDTPGCTPYICGPVLPGDCGGPALDPTQPNEGRPNGAGDWTPDPNTQEQLPEEVIGRQYDNGCYQQTVDYVYCPPIVMPEPAAAPVVTPQVVTTPRGGVSAGDGSSFTGTNTYL